MMMEDHALTTKLVASFSTPCVVQVHPKTKIEDQDELSSLLQVPLVVSWCENVLCVEYGAS